MNAVRSFIGIFPSPEIQNQLYNLPKIFEIKPSKARWVEENNIHLTLKFLGDQQISILQNLSDLISIGAQKINPINLSISSLGFFERNYASVIFAKGIIEETENLNKLLNLIENCLVEININTKKEFDFKPHFTLTRLHRNIKSDLRLKLQTATFQPIKFKTNSLFIIKSILTSQKPIYTQLHKINLKEE
ncbi:MAG: RNA 2',3'-cyclic phosphodiesterase [Bacteroidetes bacterium]|nr:RNA 2',3'-cyclic phosphodiesterase [Bacteroidota bacterium]